MALNDIKVPKENAQGTFDEIALAASDLKLGTTANLPLKTGTGGVIEAGSFGTAAGSFCAGDDARLSDDRDPNLHAASHLPDGADELFDQSLNEADDVVFASVAAETLKDASGAVIINTDSRVIYDGSGTGASDIVFGFGDGVLETALPISFSNDNNQAAANAATTRDNLGLGDAAVEDTTAFAASGSITTSGLTQATARILGRTTASTGSIEEITVGSGLSLSAGELSATGGDTVSIESSAADVLSVSSGAISADDAGSDKLVFWDDSAGKLTHLTVGSGLAVTDTTIASTATGTIGGGTGPTDNAILRADGTGGSTAQDSPFVIPDNFTASPNNTVNHASIQATGGSTNVSVSIVPKGAGAFMLSVPDGTATGGNARGARAVDLQIERNAFGGAGAEVASGSNSVICGGRWNRATNSDTVVCGGTENTASGDTSGILAGYQNTASGSRSFVIGEQSQATATYSAVLGGFRVLSNRYGGTAHAAGQFSARGDAQRARFVLRCKTTTNTAVEMALDGSTTYLAIPSGKVMFCRIQVVGVKSDGSVVATYERQYAAKNVAGTSSEVYAAVTIGTDNASSTSLEIATVDAGDYIRIRPTGIASETWRWVASVDAVEVAYGS
jgi:hypothetical protein